MHLFFNYFSIVRDNLLMKKYYLKLFAILLNNKIFISCKNDLIDREDSIVKSSANSPMQDLLTSEETHEQEEQPDQEQDQEQQGQSEEVTPFFLQETPSINSSSKFI